MDPPLDLISEGDRAAKSGDWSAAISAWRRAITGGDTRGTQRIAWFLEESGAPDAPSRSLPWDMAAVSAGLAFAGTSFVLFAQRLDGFARDLLVILAWATYVAAAIVVVRLAHATGSRLRPTGQNLTDADLERAQARADAMTNGADTNLLESRDMRR